MLQRVEWPLTRVAMLRPPSGRPVRVRYGEIPFAAGGPATKRTLLKRRFSDRRLRFNVLYLFSAGRPDARVVSLAGRRGVPVLLNQDGVYYPFVRPDWREANEPIRGMLRAADHVLFQSEFGRRVVAEVLGERPSSWRILYNGVDTRRFHPARERKRKGPTRLLSTGGVTAEWRMRAFENLLHALAVLRRRRSDWLYEFAGPTSRGGQDFRPRMEELIERLGLAGRVYLSGGCPHEQAPDVYRRADLYLHFKPMDCCPNTALEAMASGLGVVYPLSGGVPELVGDEAGVAVPCGESRRRMTLPVPEEYAEGVAKAIERSKRLGRAARERARTNFNLEEWLESHRRIFRDLMERLKTVEARRPSPEP